MTAVLGKQMNTAVFTALTAETNCPARTQIRAITLLVTPA